jgi:hypothetical protein
VDRSIGSTASIAASAFARDIELAHVRNVEQPGVGARPQVFGDDAFVLHRHPVAGEFDHAPAARAVPAIERQGQGPASGSRIR